MFDPAKPIVTGHAELLKLRQAIWDLHKASAYYIESVPIKEVFQGETVWEGVVEVYYLTDHRAPRAYAWSHETDSGGRRYVAVLHVPPVDTPRKAVQVVILHESRQRGD